MGTSVLIPVLVGLVALLLGALVSKLTSDTKFVQLQETTNKININIARLIERDTSHGGNISDLKETVKNLEKRLSVAELKIASHHA